MTEIPRFWRTKDTRYRLQGEVCPNCEKKIFPPRDVCPECHHNAKQEYIFSGKGEVFSYTTIYDAPKGFEEQAPYPVALVKLEEGPMVTAQLTDLEYHIEEKIIDGEEREVKVYNIETGMPVEMVTRKLKVDGDEDRGQIVYGYKFRPPLRPSSTEVSTSSK
jgi:uncharacterized OB-fold protein